MNITCSTSAANTTYNILTTQYIIIIWYILSNSQSLIIGPHKHRQFWMNKQNLESHLALDLGCSPSLQENQAPVLSQQCRGETQSHWGSPPPVPQGCPSTWVCSLAFWLCQSCRWRISGAFSFSKEPSGACRSLPSLRGASVLWRYGCYITKNPRVGNKTMPW
jgi:hypothetical protein